MSGHQQFVEHLFNGTAAEEGIIKYFKEQYGLISAVVCVGRYNGFEWVRLNDLSSALWMRYRTNISHYIPYINSATVDNKLITSLLATLSVEQRKKWITENIEYKDKICVECGSFEPDKKKCIHHDCCGMCSDCFAIKNPEGFENCYCCEEKQEVICPICQDNFTPENLVKSEQCSHHICWSCFGRSVKSSRPLSHCPLCRGVFCEKLMDKDYDSSDDEMPPLEDEVDWVNGSVALNLEEFDAVRTAIETNRVALRI